MRRRVYLLWYVCSRGPFPPFLSSTLPTPHFPSARLAVLALPASRPPRGLPGWSVGREPRHSQAAVKAAMARVVGCRRCARAGHIGYGSLIRTSPLPSTIPPALYGLHPFLFFRAMVWTRLRLFCWGKELSARPVFIIFGEMSSALPCGWRGRALLIDNKRFFTFPPCPPFPLFVLRGPQ